MSEERKLQFRGGIGMSLIPVAIYVFFCMVLFIGFKAFNMEALAVGGFLALLIGGVFCTSYSDFWESAIKGISSITSVSVVVILLLVGMFSALIKLCGLSGGFVWIANAVGMKGGIFVAFTFIASCIVSTATGSSIGTMFIAFPIFYPAGIMLGANEMMMAGCIVSGAIFGDNLAPISDTTIASASTQQFKNGKPADIGGVVSSRIKYSAVAGLITIVIFAVFGGMGGVYEGGSIDAAANPGFFGDADSGCSDVNCFNKNEKYLRRYFSGSGNGYCGWPGSRTFHSGTGIFQRRGKQCSSRLFDRWHQQHFADLRTGHFGIWHHGSFE